MACLQYKGTGTEKNLEVCTITSLILSETFSFNYKSYQRPDTFLKINNHFEDNRNIRSELSTSLENGLALLIAVYQMIRYQMMELIDLQEIYGLDISIPDDGIV